MLKSVLKGTRGKLVRMWRGSSPRSLFADRPSHPAPFLQNGTASAIWPRSKNQGKKLHLLSRRTVSCSAQNKSYFSRNIAQLKKLPRDLLTTRAEIPDKCECHQKEQSGSRVYYTGRTECIKHFFFLFNAQMLTFRFNKLLSKTGRLLSTQFLLYAVSQKTTNKYTAKLEK